MSIIYKLESCEIMGACLEVDKEKGSGFVELVYQECLENMSALPFELFRVFSVFRGSPKK